MSPSAQEIVYVVFTLHRCSGFWCGSASLRKWVCSFFFILQDLLPLGFPSDLKSGFSHLFFLWCGSLPFSLLYSSMPLPLYLSCTCPVSHCSKKAHFLPLFGVFFSLPIQIMSRVTGVLNYQLVNKSLQLYSHPSLFPSHGCFASFSSSAIRPAHATQLGSVYRFLT